MQTEFPSELPPPLPPMLPEQPPERGWQLEAILIFGSGLLLSLALGMMATQAFNHYASHLNVAQRKFGGFVISNLFFQGATLLLTHFFLRRHETSWSDFLGLGKPGLKRAVLFGLVTAVLVVVGAELLLWISAALLRLLQETPEVQPTIQVLRVSVTLGQRIAFGFAAIVLAPIAEEILFRGILYRYLKQIIHPHMAVVGSSLLFGIIHGNLVALVPLSFVGVVFALLYDKTDRLVAPIAAHACFNAINLLDYVRSLNT